MNWFTSIFKTFGPRLLGTAASAVAGYVVVKSKGVVQIDPTTLIEVGTAMIGSYAATHRATSAKVNKGDAASARVAEGIDKAADDPHASDTVVIPPK